MIDQLDTVGGGGGADGGEALRLGEDDVGEEHEEEAGDEAQVQVPLRPPLHRRLPRLRLAPHRSISFSSSSPSLTLMITGVYMG